VSEVGSVRAMRAQAHDSRPYRADIDGLRAIAVLAVVSYHAFPAWVSGGFVGVDVFFVISGYLITGILLQSQREHRFNIFAFYARRIRRIFPALTMVLLVALIFGWFALFAKEYTQLGKHTAGGAGFVSNWVLWKESSYFDNEAVTKPLLHLWSLGIEEQFYLVWPVLLYVGWKLRVDALFLILVIGVISFAMNVALVHDHAVATFYSPVTRVWELALGGILASLALRRPFREAQSTGVVRHGLSMAGGICIATSVFLLDRWSRFPGWWALLPTVGAAMVIAAGPDAWLNRRLLSRRILVWVGLISFPLYLWHWPLLSFLRIVESSQPVIGLRIGAVIASIALAWLTYWFIERPVRFGGNAKVKTALVSAALAATGLAGYVVLKHEGFPFRLAAYERKLRVSSPVVESTPACKALVRVDSRYCLLDDSSRAPTVALIGDSHANRLWGSLSEKYRAEGENLVQLGGGGCLPFWDVRTGEQGEPNRCEAMMPAELDYALASLSIRKVLFLNRGPWFIEGSDLYYRTRSLLQDLRRPDDNDRPRIYANALNAVVTRFASAGKTVIVVIDSPEFSYDPRTCLGVDRPFASPFRPKPDCRIMRSVVEARNKAYVEISAAAVRAVPGARLINLQDALCDDRFCYAIRNGRLLYRDADHLNEYGTQYVMAKLGHLF
jgi:peptidoglycan/LPS O-acetylase OafA/YrhL